MIQHSNILVEGGDCWGPPDWYRLGRQAGGEGGRQEVKEAQEVKEVSRGLRRQGRQEVKEAGRR